MSRIPPITMDEASPEVSAFHAALEPLESSDDVFGRMREHVSEGPA